MKYVVTKDLDDTKELFTTEEEALNALKTDQSDRVNLKFCPLIHTVCQNACVCFIKAYVRSFKLKSGKILDNTSRNYLPEGEYFLVEEASCGNSMFFGNQSE